MSLVAMLTGGEDIWASQRYSLQLNGPPRCGAMLTGVGTIGIPIAGLKQPDDGSSD
jgi:hypothetical protein